MRDFLGLLQCEVLRAGGGLARESAPDGSVQLRAAGVPAKAVATAAGMCRDIGDALVSLLGDERRGSFGAAR